ncbi:E3 ubiquitin-protein ligase ATL42 [Morus notabilis]|nr:E3 ubiquitin-protein ligase ATL42 [Morus notabilis]
MNRLSAIVLHLVFVALHVEADAYGPDYPMGSDYESLKPSLAIVLGVLSVMFVLTFLLLAYAKFCHRRVSANRNPQQTGIISASRRFSGIDKTVIESLPFFRFSSLKGSKEGLECAVCLSKFEDIEVLRLLPKCNHAFHINCIDHWLEKHSSCPLCRHRVSSEDLKLITYSDSARFLWNNQSEMREDSNNMELFVQREESHRGSSRFSIGSSFRKIHEKGHHKEEELLIQQETEADQKVFHKHNHKILVSDFVFKNRWSNVSSSDLIFLSSEMLNDKSSGRFASTDWNNDPTSTRKAVENGEMMKTKEEMEMKKSFESKVGTISTSVSNPVPSSAFEDEASTSSHTSRSVMNSGEQRSVSEITAFSRYGDLGGKNRIGESSSLFENNVKEERMRRAWLPIARRTVQWFANREKRSQLSQNPPRQTLDV